ncbi:hypothetical protein JCM16303_002490 [Sporobolomyces ruberrimus]
MSTSGPPSIDGEPNGGDNFSTSSGTPTDSHEVDRGPLDSLGTLKSALPSSTTLQADPTSKKRAPPQQIATSDFNSERVGTDQPLFPPLQASALGLTDGNDSPNEDDRQLEGIYATRRLGTTKFFNASKGFGFILDHKAQELGDAEVFVHYTAIQSVQGGARAFKSLCEGEEVSYLVTQGSKGWQAQDVTGPTGGPCIGTTPASPPARVPYTFPRSTGRISTNSDGRNGTKLDRYDRRPSGMVGMSNTNGGPRSARSGPRFSSMSAPSPVETYSNISSPPSQASSQLPGTPQTPYFYPLPPTLVGSSMVFPGGIPHSIFYASPHPHDPQAQLAYYAGPPPAHLSNGAPYYPPISNGYPTSPHPGPSYPVMASPDHHHLPNHQHDFAQPGHYPISSSSGSIPHSLHSPHSHSKTLSIESSPAPPLNPYSDLYGTMPDDYRNVQPPAFGYPISSRAS